ncbi:hypothetical protein A2810_00665 [candidate division Kazan bacterium RIFCSPHIGHO2_01_FULL_49_10]|uniref:EfeO-type cupredoxin-like domain-containing protein n=1 Tax=candidate division Kazan bacterium RIFCSPLOWO2_01_FULL_48_13 TaxID=1798539 RepID=A0A1F4PN67_UNCK3|nr:MAG: hypothetical protein A2810_00665 [candidate division Kazan bacterium RIFCSPHIGHO2_01_FULL_49_10]OGB85127.1 MAG: hypothetical protein A2994_03800 [candidate division Kazan bacterium RIFCSPLOWO2_01_FULL_48_13]
MTNLQKTLMILAGAALLMGAGCGAKSNTTSSLDTDQPATNQPANNSTTQPSDAATNPKTVTVNYTGSAFSPNSITINVGDTVKFVNIGQTAAIWPAAGPHPIHTSVPGFDAGAPLDTGGTYSFTFTKSETVKYHNHLNPSQTGTIIVK